MSILPWSYRAVLVGCVALALGCASARQAAAPASAGGDVSAGAAQDADVADAAAAAAPAPVPAQQPVPGKPGTPVPAPADAGESGEGRSAPSGRTTHGPGQPSAGSAPLLLVPPAPAPPAAGAQGSAASTGSQPSSGAQSGGAGAGALVDGDKGGRQGLAAALVRMVPSAVRVAVGDLLSIRVEIAGASDVGSVPFHVAYNPAVLKFEGGREGRFLQGDGRATAFFAAPMSNGSEAVIGLSRLGAGDGIGGGGELCTLNFKVVGRGEAGLAFTRAHVRDSANRIAEANFQSASVTAY